MHEESESDFCATLSRRGVQSRRSEHIEDLFPLAEKTSIAWVDSLVDDFEKEATEIATKAGFSELLVQQLLGDLQSGYEDFGTEMGLIFPVVYVKGFDIITNPLLILLRKGLILTIHSRKIVRFLNLRKHAEPFLRKLPKDLEQNDWLTLLLVRIIDENNSKNFEQLHKIDEGSEDLTQHLMADTVERNHVGDQIYQMKHALVLYLSDLWATSDVLSSLRYGDSNLLSDESKVLDKVSMLMNEVHTQQGLAEHLAEVLASGLECLQSIYNNQLQDKNNQLQDRNNQLQDINNQLQDRNNRLTTINNRLSVVNNRVTLLGGWLAILAAGFVVPNTIATVFSQTNIFLLTPRDTGWYLALIIGSTILATTLVWLWVRKIGLLPKVKKEIEEIGIDAEKEKT